MLKTFTYQEGLRDGNKELMYGLNVRNTIRQQTVSVGVAATAIPATSLDKRTTLLIRNNSANVVYLGGIGVTTVDGFPIYPRDVFKIDLEDKVTLYGIASIVSELRIIEGA